MLGKLKKSKFNLSKKQLYLIFPIFSFHLIGIISSLLRPKSGVEISLPLHLLRFFSWWSVHASILTILAVILIWRERKTTSPYFLQILVLVATLYNLVTLCFISAYFLTGKIKSYGFWLDLQLSSWHFVAPFLTIFYFYFYAQIDKLKEKLVKTLLLTLIFPFFYFFYTFTLAKIHRGDSKSSLFPYMEKYPYFIFEWITERKWYWLIINLLIASFILTLLCFLIILTKAIYDNRKVKSRKIFG